MLTGCIINRSSLDQNYEGFHLRIQSRYKSIQQPNINVSIAKRSNYVNQSVINQMNRDIN